VIELRGGQRPLVIGHRGAAALARENSLAAIEAGVAAGVDGVEVDVIRGRDGTLVLAHGPEIPPDAAPLAAGLALAREHGVFVHLDVKVRGAEADIVDALRQEHMLERSFVSSSSLTSLAAFASHAPELRRAVSYPEDRLGVSSTPVLRPLLRPGLAAMRSLLPRRLPRWVAAVDAAAASLNWAVVTPAAVAACHELGVAVLVWTVNDRDLATTLVERDIDAIITDDPTTVPGGMTDQ
jgi:glycerophosphoryl diester phosphodiesterase